MKYGPTAIVNPCANKTDQALYDGKNNEGHCDCVIDDRHLVYYDGECYQQNIQVRPKDDTNQESSDLINYIIKGPLPKLLTIGPGWRKANLWTNPG